MFLKINLYDCLSFLNVCVGLYLCLRACDLPFHDAYILSVYMLTFQFIFETRLIIFSD